MDRETSILTALEVKMSVNCKGPFLNFRIQFTQKYNLLFYCLCPEMEDINRDLTGTLE